MGEGNNGNIGNWNAISSAI